MPCRCRNPRGRTAATIGRDLRASATALQWVTGAYSLVFGGLMLVFGAVADRAGRRRTMLAGLALLAVASLATAFVTSAGQLIAVRAAMGVAAAMTTPQSMALAFRLFAADRLRVSAMTLISTIGLVGLAVGPAAGGFLLAFVPWQALLLVNVPIAALAFAGVRIGIGADDAAGLHRHPVDVAGAALGTAAIVPALFAPTLFVTEGAGHWGPWTAAAGAVAALIAFVVRERSAVHPLLGLRLVARPLVSSGLAYKAATDLATAGLGYLWVAVALVLNAAGMRMVGVVAGTNVLRGLPENRTSIGAALVDTSAQVATALGVAVTGTIIAALFTGEITSPHWSTRQTAQFRDAITIAGLTLTVVAAALVAWGILSARGARAERAA